MIKLWLLVGVTAFVVIVGIVEAWSHRRTLLRIPIRIHINGTRGKSSVTRLIAAGLREGGLVTCAKTTGTLPRMILPNASEYPIFRPAKANVIEQLRILRSAADLKAQVMVIECMALIPHLQWLSEAMLVKATHGVITNARADHLDVMGPGETDVAKALCGMVPHGGKLFTCERRLLDVLRYAARDRRTNLVAVTAEDCAAISKEDLAGFKYVEHADNVALALRVCADVGVDRETALRGMWKCSPDPGAMTTHELDFFGRRIIFVNGFAANDPESTGYLWKLVCERYPEANKRIAIINCRADRPDRSQQLGQACVDWLPADYYVLIGTGTYIFARTATAAGLDSFKIVFSEDKRVEEIFETVLELGGKSALVMGMGNIGGPGLPVVRFFKNRSVITEATSA